MNIVIIGSGRIGLELAARLTEEGHDLTIIDKSEERLDFVSNNLDVMTVHGNGADYNTQISSGVQDSDLLICVTTDDAVNMLSCITGKKLGVKNTIARVRTVEYYRQMVFLREELGISMAFNPEKSTADEISRILRFPSADNVASFANGRAELVEFIVPESCALSGFPLTRFGHKYGSGILVCAVERDGDVTIPRGDFVIGTGDRLYFVGARSEVSSFFKSAGIYKRGVGRVTILGGSRISLYLADQLIKVGMHVKIIESNPDHCQELKKILHRAEIICGDGTDPQVLEEEGVSDTDAFVALTGSDQSNIITAMFATRMGVSKVIAKVNEEHYRNMLPPSTNVSFVVPKSIAADFVVQYVRGLQNSLGASGIESLHEIAGGKAEALEFSVMKSDKSIEKPIKTLSIRSDTLLAAIIRSNKCIIPSGDDKVLPGDRVVAVTTKFGMQRFSDIFEEQT